MEKSMSQTLPRLRMNLDFMRSPVPDRPGLLIRDPRQYSDTTLIIPPQLVPALQLLDGEATELDLRQFLVQATGQLDVSGLAAQLIGALSDAGFLDNEIFASMRDARHHAFAESPVRIAAHVGGAYPDSAEEMSRYFDSHLEGSSRPAAHPGLIGVAAPHVSPDGGWESYADAYRSLPRDHSERIFVILGTSHYGQPDKFGLTRKDFVSPLGQTRTAADLAEELAAKAPDAVLMEDYCHASEHSIEFQVVFLQHLYGPQVRILPILCGPYARSLYEGGMPEDDENVRRFLGALGEMNAARNDLTWILGVDMAHIGARYQDPFPALAHQGEMLAVSAQDKDRISRIESGDARGFWELIQPDQDPLKWCGSAPIYTFLKAVPQVRGTMLRYQHWQIDPQSVVSFAAMTFHSA
jgi:AmmeMemoRadiSam system protein B